MLVEGREKTREVGELVAEALPGDRYRGLHRNVGFWTGLRNRVAHRNLPALDAVVIPQAQAGLLNLEEVLGEHFGPDYLLSESLSVPLQLTGFRDPGVLASIKKLQAGLPLDVQTYLPSQADANDGFADDPTYMLRVTFIPAVPASGRNPDVVAYFVKPGEVSEELGQALKEYTVLPKLMSPPRPNLIASARNLTVRPPRGASDETVTDPRYCEWVGSVKRHLYNQAWVDRLVRELSTADGFRAATGVEPIPRS